MSEPSLTEFLLARIAEDEAEQPCEWGCHDRVLAECEAKRRIVGIHSVYEEGDQHDCPGEWVGYVDAPHEPCPTLRLLAAVYADHPDFREEWRP